jgi:C4-dicarboxylate-specific signal transduction histidine kinase
MYGYDSELIQAILSILANAQDILIHKEEKVIQIKTEEDEQYIHLTIHDSGGGIPENLMKNIFEPYFTTKHKSQGTGMGLYSAYVIITNRMGGEISAINEQFFYQNQSYFGAKFILKIPKAI